MNSNFLIFGASGLIGGHFKEACENNEKEFISIGRRYLPKIDTNKQCIINFDSFESLNEFFKVFDINLNLLRESFSFFLLYSIKFSTISKQKKFFQFFSTILAAFFKLELSI